MSINLDLDLNSAAPGAHELRLRFLWPTDFDHIVGGTVLIRQHSISVSHAFRCYGVDLNTFCCDLRTLHSTLEGTATFVDQEGSVELCVSMADPSRGQVNVSAKFEHQIESPFSSEPSFKWMSFTGFGIDQSCLPQLALQIDSFLLQTGVKTEHPTLW